MLREADGTALDAPTLYALLRLRAQVFVVEQDCPYLDPDGRDLEPGVRHLWIEEDGEVQAVLRVLRDEDGTARIGRVVTAPRARGRGLAGRLLRRALELVDPPVVLEAQAHLAGWYATFGFAVVGEEYLEDGIPHVPMRLEGGRLGKAH